MSNWRDKAACLGAPDPDIWHAASGSQDERDAQAVCYGCPVRAACLADADRVEVPGHVWGVRGGLTAEERTARRARARARAA